jgi:hypothetical protein
LTDRARFDLLSTRQLESISVTDDVFLWVFPEFVQYFKIYHTSFNLHNLIKSCLYSVYTFFSVFKALTLRTVHGRRIFHTWEETEALVADGKVDVNALISHRLGACLGDKEW